MINLRISSIDNAGKIILVTLYLLIITIMKGGCARSHDIELLSPSATNDSQEAVPTMTKQPTLTSTLQPMVATTEIFSSSNSPAVIKITDTRIPTPTSDPPKLPGPIQEGRYIRHTVAIGLGTVSSVHVIDLDGDGDQDIIGADVAGDQIAWWRNDGGNPIKWSQLVLDSGVDGAIYVYASDIDGDSDVDLLLAASGDGEIVWWRNDGGHPLVWTKVTLGNYLKEPQGVYAADLDGDGDTDVLGTSARQNMVLWWENESPAGDGTSWAKHTIGNNFHNTQTVEAADIDGDGYLDVIAGAGDDDEVAWWRNDGGDPINWHKQSINKHFDWVHWVHVVDLDGDDRLDVLGAAYLDNEITWWRNTGGDPIEWERQRIDENFPGALMVHSADLDNDGDEDVIGTANNIAEIAWWRNDGGQPIIWTKQLISSDFPAAWPVYAADMDGDGDIDVIGGSGDDIVWWENDVIEDNIAIITGANFEPILHNRDWEARIDSIHGMQMSLVPAGCFMMGNADGFFDEQPVHEVCIEQDFWIAVTEVTNGQFAEFLNSQQVTLDNSSKWIDLVRYTFPGIGTTPLEIFLEGGVWRTRAGYQNRPVGYVTWHGANAYCAWRGGRLPTEAEWEYAARGPDGWIYPWGNQLIHDNAVRIRERIPQVGSIQGGASWVDALDMSSSHFEWVSSIYEPYPYDPHDGREANIDMDSSSERVLRSGSWYHPDIVPDTFTTTVRFSARPQSGGAVYGFRCVVDANN